MNNGKNKANFCLECGHFNRVKYPDSKLLSAGFCKLWRKKVNAQDGACRKFDRVRNAEKISKEATEDISIEECLRYIRVLCNRCYVFTGCGELCGMCGPELRKICGKPYGADKLKDQSEIVATGC